MLRCVGDTLVRELGLGAGNAFFTFREVDPARLYEARWPAVSACAGAARSGA
jgi:hypothetical protein